MARRSTRLTLALGSIALALPLALAGCSGHSGPPAYKGEGSQYVKLLWDKYGECLGKLEVGGFSYNPGGVDPRQVGTLIASSKTVQAYFAVVKGVKAGDPVVVVPDGATATAMKSAGC